jgi:hypothetical protein
LFAFVLARHLFLLVIPEKAGGSSDLCICSSSLRKQGSSVFALAVIPAKAGTHFVFAPGFRMPELPLLRSGSLFFAGPKKSNQKKWPAL